MIFTQLAFCHWKLLFVAIISAKFSFRDLIFINNNSNNDSNNNYKFSEINFVQFFFLPTQKEIFSKFSQVVKNFLIDQLWAILLLIQLFIFF